MQGETAKNGCEEPCRYAIKSYLNAACSQLKYYLVPTASESRYDWICEQGDPVVKPLTEVFDNIDRILYTATSCPEGTFQSGDLCLTCAPSCGKKGCTESNNASACLSCTSTTMYLEVVGTQSNGAPYGECRTEEEFDKDASAVYYKDPHSKHAYRGGCPSWMYTSNDDPPICYGKSLASVDWCPTRYEAVGEKLCIKRSGGMGISYWLSLLVLFLAF